MADISGYISNFKKASYGEEVRDDLIALCEAVNADSTYAASTTKGIDDRVTALETSNSTTQSALNQMRTDMAEAVDSAASAYDLSMEIQSLLESISATLSTKIDDVDVIDGYLYLLSNGETVAGPYGPFSGGGGSGSGGSSGNNATLTVANGSGWASKTVAKNADCVFTVVWSSIEDELATGNGTAKIIVNGATMANLDIAQGSQDINLAKYLSTGTNAVQLTISDVYGNSRTLRLTVKVIEFSLTSTFDNSGVFNDTIAFTYTPTGSYSKTVNFYLDGSLIGTQTVSTSGRQQTYYISAQSHGSHSLECYFTAEIDGQMLESNHLYYDLICVKPGDYTPIIAVDFNESSVSQYSSIIIPYTVYDPDALTAEVELRMNGNLVSTVTVDRSRQTWSLRANDAGSLTLSLTCGETVKTISLTVTEVDIDTKAETNDLVLALSSYGRSNGEANPGVWESGSVSCTFTDFNWTSDGWQTDDDGCTVMRVTGDARLTIPYQPFASDFRISGKTIEIEFATRDVRDYDAEIISCMSGGRGLKLTAQEASLKSEQSSISMQYKDDEHLRVSFVAEKREENRLIYCYVDGIISGIVQYPAADDFSQNYPVGISIGSSDCTVDLYNIRVYDNDLTKHQMLDNWIADTPDGSTMLDRYAHNNVYDEYGQIVIANLPKDLPYMILEASSLPQSKGDKKTISGQYVDPVNSSKSFTFTGCEIDVQGTSSAGYARKNYKMKFKGGFVTSSGTSETYALRSGAIPTNVFTMKADVASSEGCNNVELVRLYNDACPYKTPPQLENSAVRQGIDGFPMVIFWNDGDTTTFLGKYNFNNDKSTEEVYGFEDGDESWETLNNTSDRALFKSWSDGSWTGDFEGRYPDGNTDTANLKSFVQTVAGWSNPTKAQVEAVAEKQSALFYFLFTELFLMVDSRAKNAFPTRYSGDKWCWLPYDFDTAIGINNEGQLAFGYSLETGDKLSGGADVFNGEGHAFWAAIKDLYQDELATMYESLRNSGALSYDKVESMFSEHQAKWPEAIFNEDAQYKYLDPLIKQNDGAYLTMLQGSKKSQRQWWLKHRFQYMDSKYNVADNKTQIITVRGYAKSDLTITPYADMYVNVKYGSYLVSTRGSRNVAYTMSCPLDNVNDTETYIYGCDCIKKVDGLPAYQVGYANFAMATKLVEIILGSAESSYTNERLTELYLGNLKLLQKIDCRNCVALGTGTTATVDASGCSNIEEIYMDGTAITGIDLPNGGQLRVLHLPSTITNLTIRNQRKLEDVTIASYSNITTLWIENCNLIDPISLLDEIADSARVRLIGLDLGAMTVDDLSDLYDTLDGFRGLNENGNNMDQAQISGTVHISALTGAEYAELKDRYPYVTITYDTLTSYLYFMSEDGTTQYLKLAVANGGDATYTGSTPAKSSTAQYTYSFDGWSRTIGGAVWSDALKNVTGDRYVYAHFASTIRTYTVTFVNGTETLTTVYNVPYGGTAVYDGPDTSTLTDPDGSGQAFVAWVPSNTGITGTTTCKATYASPVEVAEITDSWDQIITACEDGTYLTKYSVGNYKALDLGTEGTVNMQIVGIDKDTLADNSGTAPLSFLSMELLNSTHRMNPSAYGYPNYGWKNANSWSTASGSSSSSKSVSSQNQYSDGENLTTAHAVYTLTSAIDQDIIIGWKTNSTGKGVVSVSIDGVSAVSDFDSTTEGTTTVSAAAETAITIDVTYTRNTSSTTSSAYATLRMDPQGGGSVTYTSTVDQCSIRYEASYSAGGATGGWENCEMRSYLKNTIKPLIPQTVRDAIVSVSKTQVAYTAAADATETNSSFNQTSTDDVWIPSYPEMFSTLANGGLYRAIFSSNNDRKKYGVGTTSYQSYWLRSANNVYVFRYVNTDGSNSNDIANNSRRVALGFCL